ncbi:MULTISPECIES: flagellar hook-associated protein FlgL [unclassified Pseudoalteromonas]|uniref:flagellar hook-associated protein FlgL n=1 Tax=unclassified Pseudoalteromonas TaxID=194690 RepID=UPI0003F75A31|nr:MULTISPECIES: flagellar hook-associated protein FlgL [unclassified Pseudoalteromonas]MDC9497148.1 flagellar hook-associated protein FlgL [Pseudoalteromonas sp. Angola-20]MDC9519242.1 flagellar hook-associated protein FlgL [Pseudoalteromonas sp. Angola-22]MDC9535649.1 flagellar hook-associated protein FlgL [Pseudoalteromonas sp. Angola-9]TMP84218.1 flagellar hook-associated protein 3 [Pseudoalteromonas sp. S983]
MRLSNNLMYQNNINKILDNQQSVANAQEQVTTGKKYLTTSEAPAAISQGMLYSNKIQTNEQYTKNIDQLTGRLETEETILQSINTNIQQAQELAIQAGNGAYTQDDLESIAAELSEIQKTLVNLMNTRSEDGKFIFSGYQDSTQPYQLDSTTGEYTYNGDQGQHVITIAEGVSIKSSDNGFDTFEKTDARLNVLDNKAGIPTTTPANNITKGTVYVDGQAEFDKFHQANYNADPATPVSPTANTFNVVTTAGATVNDPDTYEILQDGVPLDPPQTGEVNDNTIEFAGIKIGFEGAAPGQLDFTLEKPHKENVLNTLQSLITGLNDGTLEGDDFQQVLADGVVQLQNASEQVVYTQASLGGRMNAVESVSDSNLAQDIQNISNLSDLVEVDMAEAISDLTKQETALQASQATFGRLTNLSLFDYL